MSRKQKKQIQSNLIGVVWKSHIKPPPLLDLGRGVILCLAAIGSARCLAPWQWNAFEIAVIRKHTDTHRCIYIYIYIIYRIINLVMGCWQICSLLNSLYSYCNFINYLCFSHISPLDVCSCFCSPVDFRKRNGYENQYIEIIKTKRNRTYRGTSMVAAETLANILIFPTKRKEMLALWIQRLEQKRKEYAGHAQNTRGHKRKRTEKDSRTGNERKTRKKRTQLNKQMLRSKECHTR